MARSDQAISRKTEFVDTIDGPPTRESLASIYGDYLAGLALNEILPSYPTLFWQLKNGKPESDLMDQVYPWFFPKSIKQSIGKHEWNRFHQKVRDQGEHLVMYPSIGGFGGFIDALVKKIDTQRARIVQGFSKLDVSIDPDSQKIRSIDLDGVTYQADQYFWCAPLAIVGRLLGVPFPSAHPQMLCLGSFVFERELPFAYHEILVGERGVPINAFRSLARSLAVRTTRLRSSSPIPWARWSSKRTRGLRIPILILRSSGCFSRTIR